MKAKQYKLDRAVQEYQDGKASVGKGAEMAGVSLWEFMETLRERNVSNPLTEEDYQQGLKNVKKLLLR